jgi:uncharacterized protein with HEPN domain
MHADAAKLLWDAQQAVQRIERFLSGKRFDDYQRDDLLRSAVERQFEVVGEALNQLSKADPATALQIAALPRIVAFRNILIHGYASVDNRLVWGVVETQLPQLAAVLTRLLAEP